MATRVFPTRTITARPWRLDALVLERVRLRAWDRLLFVECGDGWLAEEAWRRMGRGWVCGLSASSRLVDRATRLRGVPGRVEFKTWDGACFPVGDRSIDRVIWCVSWRVGRAPSLALREAARVLELDGDAYLLDPGWSAEDGVDAPLREAGLAMVARYRCELPSNEWGNREAPTIIHVRRVDAPPAH